MRKHHGLLSLLLLLAACGEVPADEADPADPAATGQVGAQQQQQARTYEFCDATLTHRDLLGLFNGNLVFVAENRDRGASAAEMITGLVATLVVNGLGASEPYEYEFADGDYSLTSGGIGYAFSFYFAEDFGDYKADDKIPYDLFDFDSYVTNVSFKIGRDLSYEYSYDRGPLFDLINGNVKLSGQGKVDLKLAGDKIKFSFSSVNDHHGKEPRQDDILHLSIQTTPATLTKVSEQFEAGAYGLDYAGTTYRSVYYALDQDFDDTVFYIKQDDDGYFWEGEYQSIMTKGDRTLYQKGLASARQPNYTEYYCDAKHATRVGTARHAADLDGGTFEFEDGTTFTYGLGAF